MSNRRTSSTVANALRVLLELADAPDGLGVSELASRLRLGNSTVHLLLATLAEDGFVLHQPGGRYQLGLTAFEVGSAVPESARFGGVVRGPMERLADQSKEAVSLAVVHGHDAVIVQRFESTELLRAEISVGTRMPLSGSASGKCLLSGMSEAEIDQLYPREQLPRGATKALRTKRELKAQLAAVRCQGYALNVEEFTVGVVAIASPVRDRSGRVAAALSIAGPTARFVTDRWVRPVIDAATEISRVLGWRAEPVTNAVSAQA